MKSFALNRQLLSINQFYLSIFLSIYIGGLLNAVNFNRALNIGGIHDGYQIGLSLTVMVLFCYFLLELSAVASSISYKILASVLVLFSAAASYYMIFFNVVIGYGVIASVFKVTDLELASESVGYKFILWVLVFGLLPVIAINYVKLKNTFWQQVFGKSRGLITITSLILVVFLIKTSVNTIDEIGMSKSKAQNKYTAIPSGIMTSSYLPTNWIAGMSIYAYQEFGSDNKNLVDPTEIYEYVEQSSLEDTYVVFVLGETTRSDHMQLLGYPRETNPNLMNEKNLVAMNGISCDTATLLSMRCMFVREGAAADNDQREVSEHNIFYVLSKLGFSSELYAMQSEVWFYNTINADYYEMREALAANLDPNIKHFDDMVLIDYMKKSIERHTEGKHLVVLHTKGSHYSYSQRYPRDQAFFKPDCGSIDTKCTLSAQINSFDNSVRYVDLFMSRIFDQLRDKKAIVFYSADHGESINENSHFHATPKEIAPEEQFKVPMLVWASELYLDDPIRNQAFSNLRAKQKLNETAYHEEIFSSVLGCLGYQSENGGINPDNNWCAEP